ncbi:MAG: twin-arginine translocation signal domain-containing protein [Faecalibacterium sp.]
MSKQISRRVFLKYAGVSAAALGTAGVLGGCAVGGNHTSIEVKVGDQISSWNNLLVHFSGLFQLDMPVDREGYEYIAILAVVKNLSKTESYAIGAQNILELDAAYPIPPEENFSLCFHELAQSTTDFTVVCDGQSIEAGAYISLYDEATDTFSDSPVLPPKRAGYIELICMVPKGWSDLEMTFMPTFVDERTITFRMKHTDLVTAQG